MAAMADEDLLYSMPAIDKFERDMERLRMQYQQYFLGTLKREPQGLRKRLFRIVIQTRQELVTNTAVRFRLRNAVQRWNGYLTLWNRTTTQIQNGTYQRDVDRAKARNSRRDARLAAAQEQEDASDSTPPGEQRAAAAVFELDDLSIEDLEAQLSSAVAQEVETRSSAAEIRGATPRSAPTESEAAVEEAFRQLVVDRQAAGQSVEGLTMDDARRHLDVSDD